MSGADEPPRTGPPARKCSTSSASSAGSGGATPAGRREDKASPESDIHTDRDDCSSSDDGPLDSPTGPKRYDDFLRSADGIAADRPPAAKVARKQLRMIREVDVAVCHLNHTNTIISKILSSRYLRRWENHTVRLQDDCVTSNTVSAGTEVKKRRSGDLPPPLCCKDSSGDLFL